MQQSKREYCEYETRRRREGLTITDRLRSALGAEKNRKRQNLLLSSSQWQRSRGIIDMDTWRCSAFRPRLSGPGEGVTAKVIRVWIWKTKNKACTESNRTTIHVRASADAVWHLKRDWVVLHLEVSLILNLKQTVRFHQVQSFMSFICLIEAIFLKFGCPSCSVMRTWPELLATALASLVLRNKQFPELRNSWKLALEKNAESTLKTLSQPVLASGGLSSFNRHYLFTRKNANRKLKWHVPFRDPRSKISPSESAIRSHNIILEKNVRNLKEKRSRAPVRKLLCITLKTRSSEDN